MPCAAGLAIAKKHRSLGNDQHFWSFSNDDRGSLGALATAQCSACQSVLAKRHCLSMQEHWIISRYKQFCIWCCLMTFWLHAPKESWSEWGSVFIARQCERQLGLHCAHRCLAVTQSVAWLQSDSWQGDRGSRHSNLSAARTACTELDSQVWAEVTHVPGGVHSASDLHICKFCPQWFSCYKLQQSLL